MKWNWKNQYGHRNVSTQKPDLQNKDKYVFLKFLNCQQFHLTLWKIKLWRLLVQFFNAGLNHRTFICIFVWKAITMSFVTAYICIPHHTITLFMFPEATWTKKVPIFVLGLKGLFVKYEKYWTLSILISLLYNIEQLSFDEKFSFKQ